MTEFKADIPLYLRRIRGALFLVIGLGVGAVAQGLLQSSFRGTSHIDPNSITVVAECTAIVFILLITIGLLSQIWVLYSIEIDTDLKKVRVKIKRFDKVIDKGEYNLDADFIAEIKIKKRVFGGAKYTGAGRTEIDTYVLVLKYGSKKIWSETQSPLLGDFSGWTPHKFYEVVNAINDLKPKD